MRQKVQYHAGACNVFIYQERERESEKKKKNYKIHMHQKMTKSAKIWSARDAHTVQH